MEFQPHKIASILDTTLTRELSINNSSNSDLKDSHKILKQIWSIGNKHLVIIDESIIQKLRINDNITTFVEQELTNDGIWMRVKNSE